MKENKLQKWTTFQKFLEDLSLSFPLVFWKCDFQVYLRPAAHERRKIAQAMSSISHFASHGV